MGSPSGLGVSISSITNSDCHLSTNCLVVRNVKCSVAVSLCNILIILFYLDHQLARNFEWCAERAAKNSRASRPLLACTRTSFRVRLLHDFSQLPQKESLLAGLHLISLPPSCMSVFNDTLHSLSGGDWTYSKNMQGSVMITSFLFFNCSY